MAERYDCHHITRYGREIGEGKMPNQTGKIRGLCEGVLQLCEGGIVFLCVFHIYGFVNDGVYPSQDQVEYSYFATVNIMGTYSPRSICSTGVRQFEHLC